MENMKIKKKCFFVTAIGADDSETRLHMERVYANILEPVLGAEYKIIVSHRIHSADDINETI